MLKNTVKCTEIVFLKDFFVVDLHLIKVYAK